MVFNEIDYWIKKMYYIFLGLVGIKSDKLEINKLYGQSFRLTELELRRCNNYIYC